MKSFKRTLQRYHRNIRETVPTTYFLIASGICLVFIMSTIVLSVLLFHVRRIAAATVTQTNTATIIQEVARHIPLPNETPTIATVSDPTKLNQQQFFKDAMIGDKVLIFSHAQTVVLYRPSTDTIIGIAPLTSQ